MADRMDELLTHLPAEPCPADLVGRIQSRLAATRRRARWMEQGTIWSLAGAAALGTWLLIPQLGMLSEAVPGYSVSGIERWVRMALASPAEAGGALLSQALSWGSGLAECMRFGLVLALVLMAAPALYGAARMIASTSAREGVVG
ncbi:MAG: hypothetical protein MUO38_10845 [Anaerolineales bacterium]|nr:hypothetical protein [Anaerolineales bacterium]